MIRTLFVALFFLCHVVSAQPSSISLSGVVMKQGGSFPLSGVEVRLATYPSFSAVTNNMGSFLISSTAVVRGSAGSSRRPAMQIGAGSITIYNNAHDPVTRAELFSANGRRLASISAPKSGDRMAPLYMRVGELSSAVCILRISTAGGSFTRRIVGYGGGSFLIDPAVATSVAPRSAINTGKTDELIPIIDTLIATKEGFTAARFEITEYTMDNIVIRMDSIVDCGCTRESLDSIAQEYVGALEEGSVEGMNLADGVEYYENMKLCPQDSGVWRSSLRVSHSRSIIDTDSCRVFVEVVDTSDATACELGCQITVESGKIVGMNALYVTVGDWSINNKSDLRKIHKITSNEKWTIIPEGQRDGRDVIQAAGDAYLDCFLDSSAVTVPWGIPCARQEGNMYTGNINNFDDQTTTCKAGIPQDLPITDREYVVDEAMGTVSIFCKFGGGMPDSHLFRVENGKLRYVHTMSYCEVRGCPMN